VHYKQMSPRTEQVWLKSSELRETEVVEPKEAESGRWSISKSSRLGNALLGKFSALTQNLRK